MGKDIAIGDEKLRNQREERQREEQYGILTRLGWKSAGTLFLVLLIAIVVYAAFFR